MITTSEQAGETTQSAPSRPDVGLDVAAVCLRFILGIILLGHGLQKVGWFKSPGWPSSISEQVDLVGFFGYSHTNLMAWLITITEVASGSLLLLGLFTPLAAAAIIGIGFQGAAGPQWPGGLFGNESAAGLDYSLILMVAATALAFIGAGRYSLDSRLPSSIPVRGWRGGTLAVVLAVVVGTIVLVGFGVGFAGHLPPSAF